MTRHLKPVELPPTARRTPADRYDVVGTLVRAGVDRGAISVHEHENGFYWVITPSDGKCVVLTDDTEDYVVWVEGPWPFAATFHSPDDTRTELDHSMDDLVVRVAAWCG